MFELFRLVHLTVDLRERDGWARLSRTVHPLDGAVDGWGIPSGAGVIAHPDVTISRCEGPHTNSVQGAEGSRIHYFGSADAVQRPPDVSQ